MGSARTSLSNEQRKSKPTKKVQEKMNRRKRDGKGPSRKVRTENGSAFLKTLNQLRKPTPCVRGYGGQCHTKKQPAHS